MAVPDRNHKPPTIDQTEQYVLNYSFDDVYKILMVGLAAYNPAGNTYDRVQIDNVTGGLKILNMGGLVPENYAEVDLTYVSTSDRILTAVYKTLGGSTICTLTLGYDGSNRLTSVVRS